VFDEQLRRQVASIAGCFQIFECIQCAEAIEQFLKTQGIRGKLIRISTGSSEEPFGNIYHEGLQQNIATNGQHEGIALTIEDIELIFDNIHHQGIPRRIWLNNFYCPIKDLGGNFQIEEREI
jgi:hypothetical protein